MAALMFPEKYGITVDSDSSMVVDNVKAPMCFFYTLDIKGRSQCSYFTIGKVKNNINLAELIKRDDCLHNESAYEWKLKNDGWSNNYTSTRSREIFDCHLIKYVEHCDGIDFDIKILFMSMKCGELLTPSIIKSDNQIITIIRNHIMIYNNMTNTVYHNYRIEIICLEIACGTIMDLRYQGHPSCKTSLFNYQRDSIQWMINQEKSLPIVEFSDHKLFDLGNVLKLYFDYCLSGGNGNCFIKYGELPKVQVKGGIIADEVGLGKTVQALSLAISRPDIKTLIIVPNHLKEHWYNEMTKHFDMTNNPFEGIVDIKTVKECDITSDSELSEYQRFIVDELAELYASARSENHKLFTRLCELQNFMFRWGITATPFVDDSAMYNIIRFLLGNNKIYNTKIGNYIKIQETFKPFFRKNIKANVQYEIHLPEVNIHNIGLVFSEHERAILDAITSDSTYSVEEMLKLISNAMLELTNNEKTVITVEELKQFTVQRFHEKILVADEHVRSIETALSNVIEKITTSKLILEQNKDTNINILLEQNIIRELEERSRHLNIELTGAMQILERRKTVHDNYLSITENIADILRKQKQTTETINNAEDISNVEDIDDMEGIDDEIDHDKMCPICYRAYSSDTVVLFVKCRHLYCQMCFEKCHKNRPNTCPMCRTVAEVGEINYIGLDNKMITSTKNSEILRLLNNRPLDRFIIFTRFDKFITPLVNFLAMNSISAVTFDDYRSAPANIQNTYRVIMLSANTNASGTDMSYIHNVIILEPFDNYIYGKEIEKQLIGRLHRINQTHVVDVFRIYIKDTIEEEIYSLG